MITKYYHKFKYRLKNCANLIRLNWKEFKPHFQKSLFLLILFLITFFLIYETFQNFENYNIQQNLPMFLSAGASSLAALLALILIIFQINSTRIPNYHVIFGNSYDLINNRYSATNKLKSIVLISGISILTLLFSINIIMENTVKYLFIINSLLTLLSIILLILFSYDNLLISPKTKFFKNAKEIINDKLKYFESKDIFLRIKYFRNACNGKSGDYSYELIKPDYSIICNLIEAIIFSFNKKLVNPSFVGNTDFYKDIEEVTLYSLDSTNRDLHNIQAIGELSKALEKHANLVIKINSHYVPEITNMIVTIIDKLNRQWPNSNLLFSYLELLVRVNKKIILAHPYFMPDLDILVESFVVRGLCDYDLFLKLLDDMNVDAETKSVYCNHMFKKAEIYLKNMEEEELKQFAEEHNVCAMPNLNMIKFKLEELKNFNKYKRLRSNKND